LDFEKLQGTVDSICENIERVIIGKREEVRLVLGALLAGGHVLLEDVPGTGKTMLAKALSRSFDCEFGRVQFTPDLLPSELTGINFYSPKTGEFSFRKGSLFTNILLGDEINRATPRTQSGLLESMEELQVSVDGVSYPLPAPYFVIATQNPIETQGTFPLPEAQLDRFLIQLKLGYPSKEETVDILQKYVKEEPMASIGPVCDRATLMEMRQAVKSVYIHEEVYGYIVSLAEATRGHGDVALGISTRGCIALARLVQSRAAMEGRDYATPDDVKALLPYVFAHRLILHGSRRSAAIGKVLEDVLSTVPAPVEDWGSR